MEKKSLIDIARGVVDGTLKLTLPQTCSPFLVSIFQMCYKYSGQERISFETICNYFTKELQIE